MGRINRSSARASHLSGNHQNFERLYGGKKPHAKKRPDPNSNRQQRKRSKLQAGDGAQTQGRSR